MTWQRPRPSNAGPWNRSGKVQPQWMTGTGNQPPSVGPSGTRSPFRRMTRDAGAEAYARYVERISNAWRKR